VPCVSCGRLCYESAAAVNELLWISSLTWQHMQAESTWKTEQGLGEG
jgi:hypothetical protein